MESAELTYVMWAMSVILALVLFWLGYALVMHPKSTETPKDVYIDDLSLRKIEIVHCKLDWGTCVFPYRKLKLRDAPVNSDVLIRYTPPGGGEEDLDKDHYHVATAKNSAVKRVSLTNKGFFKRESVADIKLMIQIPFERQKYAAKVRHESVAGTLKIWNENSEEIRNFRLDLERPVPLRGIRIDRGSIIAVTLEIPCFALKSLETKQLGEIDSDVTMSLILNLLPQTDKREQIAVKLT